MYQGILDTNSWLLNAAYDHIVESCETIRPSSFFSTEIMIMLFFLVWFFGEACQPRLLTNL